MRRISLLLLLALCTGPRFARADDKKLDFNRDIRSDGREEVRLSGFDRGLRRLLMDDLDDVPQCTTIAPMPSQQRMMAFFLAEQIKAFKSTGKD